jgi:hypothetical protein
MGARSPPIPIAARHPFNELFPIEGQAVRFRAAQQKVPHFIFYH